MEAMAASPRTIRSSMLVPLPRNFLFYPTPGVRARRLLVRGRLDPLSQVLPPPGYRHLQGSHQAPVPRPEIRPGPRVERRSTLRNERSSPLPLQIDMHAQTPFSPSGLVEVGGIEDLHPLMPRQTVLVRFLDRDPHRYPAGVLGRYFRDEHRPVIRDAARGSASMSPPPSPSHRGSDGIPGCP
jgi:hypothetical protein